MRSSLALFLLAFLLALPILAAPATGPKRIGLRNASSTKTTNAKVRRQQARPDDIKKAAAARALQAPTKLQPRAPQVSKRMGQRLRRAAAPTLDKKDYSSFLCPGGAVACPVVDDDMTSAAITLLGASLNSVADWFRVGFECVELDTELDQCGGCTALGKG
jgi:hypothetical protein